MTHRAKATGRQGIKPHRPLLENACRTIEIRLDALLVYDAFIGQEDAVTELHAMRIAAKRLRYTLEIFAAVYERHTAFGAEYNEFIDEVKRLQEQLGHVHDADILAPEITAHLASLIALGQDKNGQDRKGIEWSVGVHHVDYDACAGLLALCRQTRNARDRYYRELVTNWKRLHDTGCFTALRALVQRVAEAKDHVTNESPAQEMVPESSAEVAIHEDTGYGRHTQSDPASAGDPATRPRSRKAGNRSSRTDSAKNGTRHSGSGADPSEGADKG